VGIGHRSSDGAGAGLPVRAALVFRWGWRLLPGRGGTGKQDPEKRRGRTMPLRASAGRRGGGGCAGVETAGTLVFFLDGTLAVLCGQSEKNRNQRGLRLGGKRKSAEPVQLMR
jgi:hypothetical protein